MVHAKIGVVYGKLLPKFLRFFVQLSKYLKKKKRQKNVLIKYGQLTSKVVLEQTDEPAKFSNLKTGS